MLVEPVTGVLYIVLCRDLRFDRHVCHCLTCLSVCVPLHICFPLLPPLSLSSLSLSLSLSLALSPSLLPSSLAVWVANIVIITLSIISTVTVTFTLFAQSRLLAHVWQIMSVTTDHCAEKKTEVEKLNSAVSRPFIQRIVLMAV